MHSDELREVEQHKGTGTLTGKSGYQIRVSYQIRVYDQMGWTGEGQPRVKLGREIQGRIWVPGDEYWARRFLGHSFTLTLKDGKHRLHLFIRDVKGQIATNDRRGIHE